MARRASSSPRDTPRLELLPPTALSRPMAPSLILADRLRRPERRVGDPGLRQLLDVRRRSRPTRF